MREHWGKKTFTFEKKYCIYTVRIYFLQRKKSLIGYGLVKKTLEDINVHLFIYKETFFFFCKISQT